MKYFALIAVALSAPLALIAQQPPPPAQAAQVLERAVAQQPGLAGTIRSRISQSGLTPEQVRARLQAAGYAPGLLDAYIAAAQPGAAEATPDPNQVAAVQALGLQPVEVQVALPVDTGLVRAAEEAETPSGVFGVDVFRRTTTQFLPTLSGPVPADYRLGPGDNLVLILTGDVELTYSLPVTREGFILIPQVGQVPVATLTLEQLRRVLYTRLGRVYSGVRRGPSATTHFDVSLGRLRTNPVFVTGEAGQPGQRGLPGG